MNILIVEDDKNLANVLQVMFAKHKTTSVTKLKSAVEFIESEKPDLVILDCMLDDTLHPGETVNSIPEMIAKSPNTAILVHTGYDDVRKTALESGAIGYIKKGSIKTLTELTKEIKTILQGSKFPHLVQELEDVLQTKL